MIFSFFQKKPERDQAEKLYFSLSEQARRPEFYTRLQVPDTTEGRFELLVCHAFLVLRRLKASNDNTLLAKKLMEVTFDQLDAALREIGVGDLSVGKKIRRLAEAFYGRMGAYEEAMNAASRIPLTDALERNLYNQPGHPYSQHMQRYIESSTACLDGCSDEELRAGTLRFAEIPLEVDAKEPQPQGNS